MKPLKIIKLLEPIRIIRLRLLQQADGNYKMIRRNILFLITMEHWMKSIFL